MSILKSDTLRQFHIYSMHSHLVLMKNVQMFSCKVSQDRVREGHKEVSLNKVSNCAALQALVKAIDSVVKKQHSA